MVVENKITEDLNFGGIKNADENKMEASNATPVEIKMGFRFVHKKRIRFVESNKLPEELYAIVYRLLALNKWRKCSTLLTTFAACED